MKWIADYMISSSNSQIIGYKFFNDTALEYVAESFMDDLDEINSMDENFLIKYDGLRMRYDIDNYNEVVFFLKYDKDNHCLQIVEEYSKDILLFDRAKIYIEEDKLIFENYSYNKNIDKDKVLHRIILRKSNLN